MNAVPYYHKIENVFQRDKITDKYISAFTRPEFDLLKGWDVSEKIDGMSVILELPENGSGYSIHGRSANTQWKDHWKSPLEKLGNRLFWDSGINDVANCRIYGELYGAGIHNGGGYGDEIKFAAFDISFGNVFVSPQVFREICQQQSIPTVPHIGHDWTIEEIVRWVEFSTDSLVFGANCMPEGVVAKSSIELKNNAGKRTMFKMKKVFCE